KINLRLIFPAFSLNILFICFQDISNQAFSSNLFILNNYYLRYPMALYHLSSCYNADNSRIMYSGYLFYFYLSANIKILEYCTSREMY
ncbi:hypothetical protein ASPFODRAFT_125874, partial [Aspergillus luchuensis CBS 106.47]